jgi:hypothetical protein
MHQSLQVPYHRMVQVQALPSQQHERPVTPLMLFWYLKDKQHLNINHRSNFMSHSVNQLTYIHCPLIWQRGKWNRYTFKRTRRVLTYTSVWSVRTHTVWSVICASHSHWCVVLQSQCFTFKWGTCAAVHTHFALQSRLCRYERKSVKWYGIRTLNRRSPLFKRKQVQSTVREVLGCRGASQESVVGGSRYSDSNQAGRSGQILVGGTFFATFFAPV